MFPFLAGQYAIMWFIFFLNITAGISIVSFLSPLYQDIWRLDHPTLERSVLAGYVFSPEVRWVGSYLNRHGSSAQTLQM